MSEYPRTGGIAKPRRGSALRRLEVDLTPVLPGGENGGAKTFALELLQRLVQLQPNCTFVLLTSDSTHEELAVLDGPTVERRLVRPRGFTLGSRAMAAPLAFMPHRIRRVLARVALRLRHALMRWSASPVSAGEPPDLLFCPFTATTYLTPGVPVVSTIHDLQYQAYPQFFSPEEHALRDGVFRSVCRDASRIVAISGYTRSEVLASGLVEAERIRVIPHRLAQRFSGFSGLADAVDIPQGPYLIYPANFWRHKNHEMLLTGFSMAIRAGLPEEMRLVLTGAPCERQLRIRDLCVAMGLEPRVVFAGHLSDAAFAAVLASADGLVFPSLFEGFGMPVLEAMALGVPVASSRLTALPEICGSAALLFDPRVPEEISAALVSIATDQSLRRRLIAEGRLRAREFADGDAMARAYWQVFEEAVAIGAARNRLHGVHADGWLASRASVEICLPPGVDEADLVFELEAPAWVPPPGPTLTAGRRGFRAQSIALVPGGSSDWRIRISGGCVGISISPPFVPSRLGVSMDDRELTVLLRACRIEYAGAPPCVLWPANDA